MLADSAVRVNRPRLRHKGQGEVEVPVHDALQKSGPTADRMPGELLRGVSTRDYEDVIPKTAATVGVKKSSISRQVIEASACQLRQLRERRWEDVEVLVIYIDGQRFGAHHIFSAVGVDLQGKKHVLGIETGATENASSVKWLLVHLRDQGLATDRKYLFVIDGAKALRAAWKLRTAEEGERRLEQLARFLESNNESAARSLREGLAEMFTLQRLNIPPSLHMCLATTNIIESPQGGVQKKTANVTRWRDQDMAERWVASAWLLTETRFRRIDGHQDLWSLAAILGRETDQRPSKKERVA